MGTMAKGFITGSMCCGYGKDGMGTNGYDCLIIPGAEKASNSEIKPDMFCGRSMGLVSNAMDGKPAVTICS